MSGASSLGEGIGSMLRFGAGMFKGGDPQTGQAAGAGAKLSLSDRISAGHDAANPARVTRRANLKAQGIKTQTAELNLEKQRSDMQHMSGEDMMKGTPRGGKDYALEQLRAKGLAHKDAEGKEYFLRGDIERERDEASEDPIQQLEFTNRSLQGLEEDTMSEQQKDKMETSVVQQFVDGTLDSPVGRTLQEEGKAFKDEFKKFTHVKSVLEENADEENQFESTKYIESLSRAEHGKRFDDLTTEQQAGIMRRKEQTDPELMKMTIGLKGDFEGNETVKAYKQVDIQYGIISSQIDQVVMGDPKTYIMIDQILINTANKIMDPGSVVRESEFERTGKGQAFRDKFPGWLKKLKAGGVGLTDENRLAMYEGVVAMQKSYQEAYNREVKSYSELATAGGMNPDLVTGQVKKQAVKGGTGKVSPKAQSFLDKYSGGK